MAGPTAGGDGQVGDDRDQADLPEIAATSGVHASWAVAGTAIASASQRGSHRARASRQPGASSRIPAVATTESANPTLVASPGSTSSSATTAAPSARAPRSRPSVPIASSATVPIAAARTTLGSVRASSTNPTIADGPHGVQPAPAHPAPPAEHQQEADHEGQVGAGDGQQVGEPGGAEVVGQAGVQAGVVAVDQRRHQRPLARAVGGRPTSRIEVADRLGAPPPRVRSGEQLAGSPRAGGHRRQAGLVGR